MKDLIERLRKTWNPSPELMLEAAEAAEALERLTAERDALKAALQLIKANTNTIDWPDDINAAIQGAGK